MFSTCVSSFGTTIIAIGAETTAVHLQASWYTKIHGGLG